MSKGSSPWIIVLLVFLLALAGGGVMEYMRRVQVKSLTAVEAEVAAAQKKAQELKSREDRLKANETQRKDAENRLMDPKNGNLYAQALMTLVTASRATGAKLEPITFSAESKQDLAKMGTSTRVAGTEAQLLHFIRRLEEGKPIGQVITITWPLIVENGADPNANSGAVTLKMDLYGPLNVAAPKPAAKPSTAAPSKPPAKP